jgi:hypothetical protein
LKKAPHPAPPPHGGRALFLRELQQRLRRVFTEPRGVQAAVDAYPDVLDSIVDAAPLDAVNRLGVYSEAYFLRILDSLETDFPATRRALGAEAFQQLAADYLQKHPSSSPNISDIGEHLSTFSQTHPVIQSLPFISELIDLEWSVLQILYTDRLPDIDAAAVQNLPADAWPQARLTLDPTVRLWDVTWAIDKLWDKRRLPEKQGGHVLQKPLGRCLLLYRDADGVQLRVIDPARLFMLRQLQAGVALGPACEALLAAFPQQADHLPVMDWFAHWLQGGIIKRFEFLKGEK